MEPDFSGRPEHLDMRPIGIHFEMGYILVATAIAGVFVAGMVYWLLSNTKRSVPSSLNLPYESASMRYHEGTLNEPSNFDDGYSDEDYDDDKKPKKKIGVKKAAKLEMKAEKRAAREAMILEREEKKREQEYLEQIRKEEEEKERKEEEEKEQQERLAREEQARKEHEAYLELAATFEVEEEGCDQEQEVDDGKKLTEFIDYINEQKVVLLEHLASHFKMRTKDVVDRVQELVANGSLVGIIDDRGKFISVTRDELGAIAKFIRQRGRVTVDELVVNSNKLINLKPLVETRSLRLNIVWQIEGSPISYNSNFNSAIFNALGPDVVDLQQSDELACQIQGRALITQQTLSSRRFIQMKEGSGVFCDRKCVPRQSQENLANLIVENPRV